MKNLLVIFALLFSTLSFSQTGNISVKKENTKTFVVEETSWTMVVPFQTVSGLNEPDTLVISGDTILTDWPDTLIVSVPYDLYDKYDCHVTLKTEAISGESALTISKVMAYTAQCGTCDFIKISEDATAPYDFTVPNMRLKLYIIASGGTGKLQTRITLKSN